MGFFILDFRVSYDHDGTSAVFSFQDFRAALPFTDFSTHWFGLDNLTQLLHECPPRMHHSCL